MTIIDLSFHSDMISAIDAGTKICTTRLKEKGRPGDIFFIEKSPYRIVDIWGMDLNSVIFNFYHLEGFSSKQDFWDFWRDIYRREWTGDENVFVHFFAPVVDDIPGVDRK